MNQNDSILVNIEALIKKLQSLEEEYDRVRISIIKPENRLRITPVKGKKHRQTKICSA